MSSRCDRDFFDPDFFDCNNRKKRRSDVLGERDFFDKKDDRRDPFFNNRCFQCGRSFIQSFEDDHNRKVWRNESSPCRGGCGCQRQRSRKKRCGCSIFW